MPARTVAILLGALLLLGACGEKNDTSAPEVKTEYIEQETDERTFNNWTLERIEFDEPVSMGHAISLRIFNDRIFVYDLANMNIKRYSSNGELEAVYGNGRGQGPGQFQNITSFWVREKEEVWIVDSRAHDVSRFRYDGTFIDNFHSESPPERVVALAADRLVLQRVAQPNLFAVVNADGEIRKRFGKVIDVPQDRYTLALDAFVFPDPNGGFVWAPLKASYLFFYNRNTTLECRLELIDGYPFPIDQMQPNPMKTPPDDPPAKTVGVSVTDEEIFVNVYAENVNGYGNVLDRYDRDTGKYLDSIRLPPGGGTHHVHDGMVYGTADTTLRAFRIHRSP
jgi:hypothetical protein